MAMVNLIHNIIIAAALTLLFIAPAATAEGETFLEASTATLGYGSSASLAPLFFSVEQGLGNNAHTPAGFELEAAELRVEMDHAVSARAQVSEPFVPENTTKDEYRAALVSGLENRAGYRFMVIPSHQTQLYVRTTCASLSASEEQQIQRVPRAANPNVRKPIEIEVTESIHWKDCGLSHLTFTGNYTLAFWEWDFEVRDAVGETTYTTGHFQHNALPGLPEGSVSVGERREAWLFVQDGSLDVQLAQGSPHFLYSGNSASVDSESGILLQDASGHIQLHDQVYDVGGQDVLLMGALSADLSRSSTGSLTAGVSGQIQGLQVDEVDVWSRATSAAAQASLRVPTWALGSGALLLFSVVLGSAGIWWSAPLLIFHVLHGDDCIRRLPANTLAQRRAAAMGCLANRLLTRTRELAGWRAWRNRELALLLSQQAHRLDPHARVYLVWRSRAYAGLGAHKKALRDCSLLNERLEGPQALSKNAVLAARCTKELGRMEEHRAWVLVASRWRSTSLQRTNRGAPLGSIRGPLSPGVTARLHESSLPC